MEFIPVKTWNEIINGGTIVGGFYEN